MSSAQRELGKSLPANTSATSPPAAENVIRSGVAIDPPRPTPRTGPYFDLAASKNVTALLGKTAYLNCRVKNLGNKTVRVLCIISNWRPLWLSARVQEATVKAN